MHHTDLSAPGAVPGVRGGEVAPSGAAGEASTVEAVRQEATEQVRTVTRAARRETQAVVGEIGTEVRVQVSQQKDRIAMLLKDLSSELAEVPPTGSGRVSDVAWDIAGRASDLSDWLRDHEPADVLRATEDLARRRPLTFLLASATAGVVVGRLTRGMIDAGTPSDPTGRATASTPAAPTPTTGAMPAPGTGAMPAPGGLLVGPGGSVPGSGPSQPWEGA